jgi:hypothetical protein
VDHVLRWLIDEEISVWWGLPADSQDPRVEEATQMAMERLVERIPPQERPVMQEAIDQMLQFVQQFDSPEAVMQALGFDMLG